MTLQTGTTGNDDFYDNLGSSTDSYDGGAGTDTLHLQVATDAVITATGSVSQYQLYNFPPPGFALTSSLTSIERVAFDSVAGSTINAGFDGTSVASSGLSTLIGGSGADHATFLVAGTVNTMPTLTLTNWSPAPTNGWDIGSDALVMVNPFQSSGSSYTLNAASGLNTLQVLVGVAGNGTFNGSANADVLDPGNDPGSVDMLYGNGGNDSIEVISEYNAFQAPNAVYTNPASVFDGGAGTDVLTIGGQVIVQSTLVSIEGVNLIPPVIPEPNQPSSFGEAAAFLTLSSAQVEELPSDAFFIGTGTVQIEVTGSTNFDGSHYVITPTPDAPPITFQIVGDDGNGISYVGTSASDTILFGDGKQTATGGGGADTFVVNDGAETITDFTPGVDKIDLSDTNITTIEQVRALASQVGPDVVASNEEGSVTLKGVSLASLTADDFVFASVNHQVASDVDGDGISDILLSSASQGAAVWRLLYDGAVWSNGVFGKPGSDYHIIGTGDFNGDGLADILFQSRNGSIATFNLDGSTVIGGGGIGSPGPNYAVIGTADFNNDGTSEVLFLNAVTGAYVGASLGNGSVIGSGTVGTPGASFVYKAAADVNGDGDADLLFQSANGSYAIWELAGSNVIGGGTIGDPGAGWYFKGTGDFNGDGKADILFEKSDGTYATWDLNGTQIIGGGTVINPGDGYTLAAIGDYNGDGKSDLLFRSADGSLTTWLLNDTQVIGSIVIGNPGSDHVVVSGQSPSAFATLVFQDAAGGAISSVLVGSDSKVGSGTLDSGGATALATGDFAGTGEVDILLGDSTGTLSYEISNATQLGGAIVGANAAPVGGAAIGNPGPHYSFVALGDFNGDGRSDILFHNTNTGAYATWDIAGGHIVGGGTISTAAGCSFVGTGDFNGDGKADILFRNDATGDYADWLLSDNTIIGGGTIGNPGADWQFKGLGDVNGDGKADIVFENSAGLYASWDLDGTAVIGGGAIGTPGGTFQLAKIADLNQDGRADLLFVDATGHYASWLLADTTILGGASLGALAAGQHVI